MTRQECAAMVVGGPTTVLDLGGLRIVGDPTFDDPGPHGYLTKTAGPAVAEDQLASPTTEPGSRSEPRAASRQGPHQSTLARTVPHLTPLASRGTPSLPR